jgi:CRISPR/Cas system CMR subunit Cmr4 (Cas7 group RAMP superfamily)
VKKLKKTKWVSTETELFVANVLNPVVMVTDGFQLTGFKNDKNIYISVPNLINWCKKEMMNPAHKNNKEILQLLKTNINVLNEKYEIFKKEIGEK